MFINYTNQGLHTEDAVATDGLPWTPQDGGTFVAELSVVARQTNAVNDAAFNQRALLRKTAGVVSVVAVGAQQKVTSAGAAGWAATVVVSGGDLVPRVTGGAGQVIEWSFHIDGMQVGPF